MEDIRWATATPVSLILDDIVEVFLATYMSKVWSAVLSTSKNTKYKNTNADKVTHCSGYLKKYKIQKIQICSQGDPLFCPPQKIQKKAKIQICWQGDPLFRLPQKSKNCKNTNMLTRWSTVPATSKWKTQLPTTYNSQTNKQGFTQNLINSWIPKKYELIDFDILTELQHITSQRGFRSSCSLVASLLHYRNQDAQQRFYVQVSFEFLINVMTIPFFCLFCLLICFDEVLKIN